MKVILYQPCNPENRNGKPSIIQLANVMPAVGLGSIAGVLRKSGHDVSVFDANLYYKISGSVWVNRIVDMNPDFVGFSTTTSNFSCAYNICRLVKERNDRIMTVFGGVHVSWGKKLIINMFPAIDFVITGEGEYSFLDLVNGKPYSEIERLYFRNGSLCEHGPLTTKHCNMDDLPFPAYDLFNGFPRKYSMALFSYPRYPGVNIISSRGCVYECTFCDRSVFGKSFRWNSPEYTYEQMKWLYTDFGVRHFSFYDDLFTLNRKRVARLCEIFMKSNMKMSFNCIVRIGDIDSKLINLLKSAGCWMVNIGIESGDQEILDSHKQGLKLEHIRSDIEKFYNAGLWVKGLFMMGFPGETEKSIKKTIDFACSLPIKDANLTAYTPFPGAKISFNINSLGSFNKSWENWENMDCLKFVFVPNGIESKEVLERYYREFIRRFYHRPFMKKIYRKMIFQSPHSYWRLLKHAPAFLKYARETKK